MKISKSFSIPQNAGGSIIMKTGTFKVNDLSSAFEANVVIESFDDYEFVAHAETSDNMGDIDTMTKMLILLGNTEICEQVVFFR